MLSVPMVDQQRIAELERRNAELERQLDSRDRRLAEAETREQAVAATLKLLSANPTDQRSVFRAILEAALAVNGGGALYLLDRDTLRHQGASRSVAGPRPDLYDGQPHPELD